MRDDGLSLVGKDSVRFSVLVFLHHLGWSFITPESVSIARNAKTSEVILREILRDELRKRRYIHMNVERAFSEGVIDSVIAELYSPTLYEGLSAANEKIYNYLLYGIPVKEFFGGKKNSLTLQIIDWQNIKNNSFLFTEKFKISQIDGAEGSTLDIVCFVNGLPLVIIEINKSDKHTEKGTMIDDAISRQIYNQSNDGIPHLFVYAQLLLSLNGQYGLYGTQGTPAKFWAPWREKDVNEHGLHALKNKRLTTNLKHILFAQQLENECSIYEPLIKNKKLAVTDQDRLLSGLLYPDKLLDMIRIFIFFDKNIGKIVARHHQVYAVKRLLGHINFEVTEKYKQGGVVWHTAGSGKSFTMLFLSKALVLHEALKKCRIIIVTDRVDLEEQLSKTFTTGGQISNNRGRNTAIATSGKRLAEQISSGSERIIFSIINKFSTASKMPGCRNLSSDIIVLVDEGHRSQGGENYNRMRCALPNAVFIAFTSTPLLKDEKTTNKFGPIIHSYTMHQAVVDETVTPLLYEERIPHLGVNNSGIDSWFDRITAGLTGQQKTDFKKEIINKNYVYQSEDRIRLIAYDIANHFYKNIDKELKGQLACDSKLSAIRYKKFMDDLGLFESTIVMSAPDKKEGDSDVDESNIPTVVRWWKENVGSQNEKNYTRDVVNRFSHHDKPNILIVVDKLLTGFDAPNNTVLYIDKPLKEHNLLQAIARINRLHPRKKFGLLIDYRGILAELDITIERYQDLEKRTQGGFDIDDLVGFYHQVSTEYMRLPELHDDLWCIFKDVIDRHDIEKLRQIILPRIRNHDDKMVDVNQEVRENFYDRFSEFKNCFEVAMQSAGFHEDKRFTENDRKFYKDTMDRCTLLHQMNQDDMSAAFNYSGYSQQVRKLIDERVVGIKIKEAKSIYEVANLGKQTDPKNWSENKTKNEIDIIKMRVTNMVEQSLCEDPYAYEIFSELLKQVIKKAEDAFAYPLRQYALFAEFEEKVAKRQVDELPVQLFSNKNAQAYYGILKISLMENEYDIKKDVADRWVRLAFDIDKIMTDALVEYSINPWDMETYTRRNLLPIIFQECRRFDLGIEQTKVMIDRIIKITYSRSALNG